MMISLWGFMGSGKTTVANALVQILNQKGFNYLVLDSDQEIEKMAGLSIKDIFTRYGEAHFRSLEQQFLQQLAKQIDSTDQIILSTGGGMPISIENRALLRQLGVSVFLDVPFEVIMKRLKDDQQRPLWQNGQEEQLRRLYGKRYAAYCEAELQLKVGEMDPQQIAAQLAKYVLSQKGQS